MRLSRDFEDMPEVRRVDSLATVPLIRDENGVLDTDSGLEDGMPSTEAAFRRFIAAVSQDRIARRSLVSEDGRVFAINLLLDGNVDADRAVLVSAVRAALANQSARVTGVPIFRTEVNSRTQSELLFFVPATLILLVVVIWLFVPSLIAVLVPLVVGGASALGALGAMSLLYVPLSLSTTILPSMLLALGCSYAMHVVAAKMEGTPEELEKVAFPIMLSGLTTSFGFLAMATVPISAIQELASFGAFGVAIATCASLSLAPALLTKFSLVVRNRTTILWIQNRFGPGLHSCVCRRRNQVLLGWAAVLASSLFGLAKLEVSTDIIQWFPKGTAVRDDYEVVRQQLSGITPVNVLVEAKSASSLDVQMPGPLQVIDSLTAALSANSIVGKALSLGDPLRLVKKVYSDDHLDRLPDNSSETEQFLLLLEGMDRLADVFQSDRRSANILLRVNDNSSDDIVELGHWVDSWWSKNGIPGYQVTTTGIMYEFGRAQEAIANGQIVGLGLAAVAITVVLLLLLRSLRATLIALAVNVAPITIGFGAMGLLHIPLDAATVCLGSMALGIAVDDTIHILTAYREQRANGFSKEIAIGLSLRRVLLAVMMTTVAISVGFGVLAASDFTLIRNLGAVTAALVVLCLLADISLLPALLLLDKEEMP